LLRVFEVGASGDVILGPESVSEAVLVGRVGLNTENAKPFMNFFFYTVVKTNPRYFSSLALADGTKVTDAATLRLYSEENGWVYDGAQISTPRLRPGPGKNYLEFKPLDGPLSLRNLYLEFIDFETYQAIIADYKTQDKLKQSRSGFLFYTLANPQIGAPILVGFVPRWQGDHYWLSRL
jgi:hypothetical protein